MKVVLLSNAITLEQKLQEVLEYHDNLRVEQASHRTFRLKKRCWFILWRQVAWMDTYYRAIRISLKEWQRHEAVIKKLARTMEKHVSVREIIIEVYP